ncbi:hypothetical protein LAZ67_1001054 [Cordylochernes scorpioides]|uniref:Uncharacterized protein n=1 Tax=Cordylochernes scorpioides TaxID=51811 RepID=A0ABY6JZS6_9ARAC|nr:hypothetical protein LAZ67_1001054 [Cordylochernes scorpioides]
MKANRRLFLILLQETKLGFTILIQKTNGNLLFGAFQNHLLLRKFVKLEVLENKWRLSAVEAGYCSFGAPIGVVAVATAAAADADRLLVVQEHVVHNDPTASSNGLVGNQVQLDEGRADAISGRRSVCHAERLVSRKLAEGIGEKEGLDNVLIRGFRLHVEETDFWEELPLLPDFQALELVVQGSDDGRNGLWSVCAGPVFPLGQIVGSADSFEDVP